MRSGWRAIAVLGLLAAGPGCGLFDSETPRTDRRSPVAFLEPQAPPPHEALEPLEAELRETLRLNAERTCPRPVLRGEASPGPADEAIRAIIEPEGSLVRCFEAAKEESAELAQACAALPAAVRAAVRHEDACSPYLHGRRAHSSLLSYIRTARGLVAIAEVWVREGRTLEAMQLLLDGVRLGQDLARGATWLEAMVAIAGASTLLRGANELLQGSPVLTAEQVTVLRGELATLLATEPHPREHLLSDHVEIQLYHLLPAYEARSWEPPGGWPDDTPRPPVATPGDLKGHLLMWITLDGLADQQQAACPPDSDLHACVEGLEALVQTLTREPRDLLADGIPNDRTIQRILESIAAPGWTRYVRRTGRRTFWLQALDLQLSVMGADACPTVEGLELGSPTLGSPLRATAEPGALLLRPPDWLVAENDDEDDGMPAWRIPCTTAETPPPGG